MNYIFKKLLLLSLTFMVFGCGAGANANNNSNITTPPPLTNEVLSISSYALGSDNQSFPWVGKIDGNNINVVVPSGININALYTQLTTNASSVLVNGVEQCIPRPPTMLWTCTGIVRSPENNFENLVTYRLIGNSNESPVSNQMVKLFIQYGTSLLVQLNR